MFIGGHEKRLAGLIGRNKVNSPVHWIFRIACSDYSGPSTIRVSCQIVLLVEIGYPCRVFSARKVAANQ